MGRISSCAAPATAHHVAPAKTGFAPGGQSYRGTSHEIASGQDEKCGVVVCEIILRTHCRANPERPLIIHSRFLRPLPGIPGRLFRGREANFRVPEGILRVPGTIGGVPGIILLVLKMILRFPGMIIRVPETIPGVPEMILCVPGTVPGVPEMILRVPGTVPGVPGMIWGVPGIIPRNRKMIPGTRGIVGNAQFFIKTARK